MRSRGSDCGACESGGCSRKDVDIRMLTLSAGKERTGAEYFTPLDAVGFNLGQVGELVGGRPVITPTPEAV